MNKQELLKYIKDEIVRLEKLKQARLPSSTTRIETIARIEGLKFALLNITSLKETSESEKTELPVVSKEFDEWVKKAQDHRFNWQNWCVKEIANMGFSDWLHDPETDEKLSHLNWTKTVKAYRHDHIKSIIDGYTVKQEPKWVVKFKSQEKLYYFVSWTNLHTFKPLGFKDVEYVHVMKFDDKAKADAVATLIDGSVEEV